MSAVYRNACRHIICDITGPQIPQFHQFCQKTLPSGGLMQLAVGYNLFFCLFYSFFISRIVNDKAVKLCSLCCNFVTFNKFKSIMTKQIPTVTSINNQNDALFHGTAMLPKADSIRICASILNVDLDASQ